MPSAIAAGSFGARLRGHRSRRGHTQEVLARTAGVSVRHLSCLETDKAAPSREMVLRLTRALELDLRERNTLLVCAGHAPVYRATPLDDGTMGAVSRALDAVLAQQDPFPAVVVDRCWNLQRLNRGAQRLLDVFLDPSRLPPHVARNPVLATLHPDGLRPYVVDWPAAATLLLERVERGHHAHPDDDERRVLLDEVRRLPDVAGLARTNPPPGAPAAVLELRRGPVSLSLFALITTVGTPLDVTAQEVVIESFFPVDGATEAWFRAG